MTATEVLRRMLDERGVEWSDDGYPTTCTVWASDGIVWHGLWRDDCIELIAHLTPEQAIAATLGTGTCKRVFYEPTGVYVCSECGYGLSKKLDKYCYLHYCPNCGAKVVDPTTNDVDVEVEQ